MALSIVAIELSVVESSPSLSKDGRSLDQLRDRLRGFASEVDWEHYHNYQTPKNLTIAIERDASRLASVLQWARPEEDTAPYMGDLEAAITELFVYVVRLCDLMDINPVHLASLTLDSG